LHKLQIRYDLRDLRMAQRMAQLLSCIAACPLLKGLTVWSALSPDIPSVPLPLLSCHLTDLTLLHTPVTDDELACLMKASSATLQRLELEFVSHLTNAGLSAALVAVCGSLKYLVIETYDGFPRAQGEEHALDATIARMERLTKLKTISKVISVLMLERRAEAFVRQCTSAAVVLPEVHLNLLMMGVTERDSLVCGVKRDWPGWKINV